MAPPNGPVRRRTSAQVPAAPGGARRRPTSQGVRATAPAPQGARLVCVSGPANGQEFPLDGDEVVIGRSADNPISIPDTSVSRKHVLLRRTGEGWAASDMGSGNGTMVNGTSISEETPLANGDVIVMGDTELQFVDEAAAPRPRRTGEGPAARRPVVRSSRAAQLASAEQNKAKKRKLFVRAGAIVAVLMAGAVGYVAIQKRHEAAALKNRILGQQALASLQEMNQKGRLLIRDGKWADAKAIFEQIQQLNPEYGAGTVQQYIDRCTTEIPNEQNLDEAAAALKKDQLGNCAKALAKVTSNTLQGDRREKIRQDLDKAIDVKVTAAAQLVASTTDREKMVQLQTMSDDVLTASPDQRDAKGFKEVADKAIYAIDHPPPPKVGPDLSWQEVQQLFHDGDQAGAMAKANACATKNARCKALMAEIQDFNERNRKLEALGPAELLSLLELEKKIGGGSAGALSKPIATRVVTAYYTKASNCRAKGDWGCAMDYAKKVLIADPGHIGAASIVADARRQAKDIFLRAYSLKDEDAETAIQLFKQVIQMTPKDDEYHDKAKSQLDHLQKN